MFNIDLRAQTLKDLVGHPNIIRTFQNYSKTISIPNYMLMMGISGSGKSTLVFLAAKLLNCKNPKLNEFGYYDPCNCCPSCLDIIENKFHRDVKYYDASNIDKEKALELGNALNQSPMQDKNKIIIIDEAHLIVSNKAKSAFLTITEKPRKNTYIFLATTDSSKFDDAFLRRFQKYYFKPIAIPDLVIYMYDTLVKLNLIEKVPESFIREGLLLIAKNSYGSPGKAISALERCVFGELYTTDKIESELNIISEEKQESIILGLLKRQSISLIELQKLGNGLEDFFNSLKYIINDALVYQLCNETNNYYNRNLVIKVANSVDQKDLFEFQQIFTNGINQVYFDQTIYIRNVLNYYNNSLSKKNVNEITNNVAVVNQQPVLRERKRS